jgi:segregation and condensation protein B
MTELQDQEHTEQNREQQSRASKLDAFDKEDLMQKIEALIFSSDEALSYSLIQKACEAPELTKSVLDELVSVLNSSYQETGRTFRIHKISGGYRFLTEKQFHNTIQKLIQPKLQRRLSQSALETLSIVAYKQPISKPEIEQIRGTGSDYVVKMLLEKELIEVTGRADSPGKPLLYGTTVHFLDYFNLYSLDDLPKPREIEELLKENQEQDMLKFNPNEPEKIVLVDNPNADQE